MHIHLNLQSLNFASIWSKLINFYSPGIIKTPTVFWLFQEQFRKKAFKLIGKLSGFLFTSRNIFADL